MAEIIKERQTVEDEAFAIEFMHEGAGYSFPCTKDGVLLEDEMTDAAKENYMLCEKGEGLFAKYERKITRIVYKYKEPAILKCDCGKELELTGEYYGSNSCDCGRWYNMFGQSLLPPEQWGDDF